MARPTDPNTTLVAPRFLTKPLAKISHAIVDREQNSPSWSHLRERDDLFVVLDRVNTLQTQGHYTEQRVLRVVCGPELVAYLNLDERLQHASMDDFRRSRAQVRIDQLPLGALVRPPNLRITYAIGESQKRMLQLKFLTETACQDVAAALDAIGLPVRAAILSDRPTSQRLSTAGSWTGMCPSSQPTSSWSPHETSSSQTTQTMQLPECSTGAEDLVALSLSQMLHSQRPNSNHDQTHTTNTAMHSSRPSGALHNPEYPLDFPSISSSPGRSTSTAEADGRGSFTMPPYHQSRNTSQLLGGQDFLYPPVSTPTGLSEPASPIHHQSITYHSSSLGDSSRTVEDTQDLSSSQSYARGIVPALYPPLTVRQISHSSMSEPRVLDSRLPFSTPFQQYHGPSTSVLPSTMAPPPVPERSLPSRDGTGSGKRKWGEPSRPPSRRSHRLALMHGLESPPLDVNVSQRPPTVTSAYATNNSELPPVRELPFPASKVQSQGASTASVETTHTQPTLGASDVPATKKPRKTPAKSTKKASPAAKAPKKSQTVSTLAPPAEVDEDGQSREEPQSNDSATPYDGSSTLKSAQQPDTPAIISAAADMSNVEQAAPKKKASKKKKSSVPNALAQEKGQHGSGPPQNDNQLLMEGSATLVTVQPTSSSSHDVESTLPNGRNPKSAPPVKKSPKKAKTLDITAPLTTPLQEEEEQQNNSGLPRNITALSREGAITALSSTQAALPAGNPEVATTGISTSNDTRNIQCQACLAREKEPAGSTQQEQQPPPPSPPPQPVMVKKDIEALIDRKLRESLGTYFAGVSPCMKEIDANFQRIAELTKQFATAPPL